MDLYVYLQAKKNAIPPMQAITDNRIMLLGLILF